MIHLSFHDHRWKTSTQVNLAILLRFHRKFMFTIWGKNILFFSVVSNSFTLPIFKWLSDSLIHSTQKPSEDLLHFHSNKYLHLSVSVTHLLRLLFCEKLKEYHFFLSWAILTRRTKSFSSRYFGFSVIPFVYCANFYSLLIIHANWPT